MFELGKLYAAEKLGKKDAEKSFEFYRKALQGFLKIEPIAKKLKPFLQFRIGQMYRNGFGTDVDIPKAITYFQQSAEHGNVHAKLIIALEYISGEFLEQDIDKGISILTECADSSDKLSCYRIGKIYLDGKITAQDLDKAEKYLLAADENEYTFYALGKLYLTEEKRDVQRSVSYFEQCSDTNPWASYWLGKIYLFGC
ncbi:sel1 repeat family protein, partial [Porcipelethomonas ammoniilytica]|uniref:tetratricopeptide repeat protein n=1 Tax=Porcipelethomonas ammoniilytica TaxID=2981722 RepID=UPI0011C7CFD5